MPKLPNPFRILAHLQPGVLFLAIADLRPATIALVLTRLPQSLAVQVAGKLDPELRRQVLCFLADGQPWDGEIIDEVAQGVQRRVVQILNSGGPAVAARILSACQPAVETSLLRDLDQQDPTTSARIRQTLMTFDDIAWLSDRSIQTLLKNVRLKTWALALTRCQLAIKQKITRNMDTWSARQLREEIDYLRLAAADEIEAARQRVVHTARYLETLART